MYIVWRRKAKSVYCDGARSEDRDDYSDEPTTYLDIAHQLDLLELLKQLNKMHEITILMVLHDLQQAAKNIVTASSR
ncbi:hypothetical protein ACEQPO_28775 [Bacillus sp. SL00103]